MGIDKMTKKRRWILLPLCLLLFTSCALADQLGFDTYDYMSDPVTGTLETDGETADAMRELLAVLITDSTELPCFENMSGAIREYRDAVLTYMLRAEYAKYSGNTPLIERAEKAYPEYNVTQIIPADDFEATMYRCFGGDVMISHKDGSRFKYLSKVGAYIATVSPEDSGLEAEILSLDETEKTYRVRFRVVSKDDGAAASEEYFALIIKRDDGTYYIKKLLTGTSVA